MSMDDRFDKIIGGLDELELTTINGRITEVVGFTREEVLLSPLGEMTGVGPSSEVIPTHLPLHIKVGPQLLGRILNGLGEPLDVETKGPLILEETYPVIQAPPD